MKLRPENAPLWRLALIDGPNMPNLGARDRAIYGPIRSLGDLHEFVTGFGDLLGVSVQTMTSNHEGEILDFIHRSALDVDGYLINPAGLTTYGEATRHPLADTGKPYAEVHFANLAVHLSAIRHAPPRIAVHRERGRARHGLPAIQLRRRGVSVDTGSRRCGLPRQRDAGRG